VFYLILIILRMHGTTNLKFNEQDVLEWTDQLCRPGFLGCPTILSFISSTVVQFANRQSLNLTEYLEYFTLPWYASDYEWIIFMHKKNLQQIVKTRHRTIIDCSWSITIRIISRLQGSCYCYHIQMKIKVALVYIGQTFTWVFSHRVARNRFQLIFRFHVTCI
jgi:hypothetical protein